ncbi:hypothetical protein QF000_001390 [Paraburkholderia atlantica]|uniref:hypothetical protein n=1 Tax=Paraburkholderia atlantica TaxID=2654982 RepID=UPI003D1BB00F
MKSRSFSALSRQFYAVIHSSLPTNRKVSGLGNATDVRFRTWSTDSIIVELAAKTSLMLVCDVDAVFDMRV